MTVRFARMLGLQFPELLQEEASVILPSLVSHFWLPSEIHHSVIGQTIESFSGLLKVTSVDGTTQGSFLIGCLKVFFNVS